MIYKGSYFHRANGHYQMSSGMIADEDRERYKKFAEENEFGHEMVIGKRVGYKATKAGKIPKNAFKTFYTWNDGEIPMYVTIVKPESRSRTDMFTTKNKTYLGYDGIVYINTRY
jgi:hypothetical protein